MGSPIIFRGKTLDEIRTVTWQHIYLKHSDVQSMHSLFQFWWITCCFPSVWLDSVAGWDCPRLRWNKLPSGLHRTTVLPVDPWQDSAVATESGHCGIWPGQEVEGDAWGLIDVAVHDCFLYVVLVCLEETDWYFLPFLFNCLICMIASFLQEYVSEHWMKNVGDMCQFISPNEWHRVDLGMPVESLGCTIPLPHVFGL